MWRVPLGPGWTGPEPPCFTAALEERLFTATVSRSR